eukprot:gene38495-35371_t
MRVPVTDAAARLSGVDVVVAPATHTHSVCGGAAGGEDEDRGYDDGVSTLGWAPPGCGGFGDVPDPLRQAVDEFVNGDAIAEGADVLATAAWL